MNEALNIEQYEMMLQDPRIINGDPTVMEELKGFISATAEHGGLLAAKQVAALANVNQTTISRHIKAGRFTVYSFCDMTLLPLDEVMVYVNARHNDSLSKGGGGLKAPKFRDILTVE